MTTASPGFDAHLDAACRQAMALGFAAVLYDYSPVPRAHDGTLITPTILETRNLPVDMAEIWCKQGYYQIDPVQDAALLVSAPFVWSHEGDQSDVMARVLRAEHRPVLDYLRHRGLTRGVTVPIRCGEGALATFTAIAPSGAPFPPEDRLSSLGLLGQSFHDRVYPGFPAASHLCPVVHLTRRERECLALCGEGLTAKEIAYRIDRSVPTVVFHLSAATRKLGARNRFQAIARAAYYRLL
ncbi:LuxR family transcriptional regulator [Rhodospirillum rubrum]|uniref:Transcriptional regulator, LuxR family n=1 Tax=Rhodospirillum rubrum (strain ATCC 11170 / ATH 1.1.1 / DSM 467 / LMG 4362 / NCIMB 8255 / S1) TaxID=269796 RepID=Q2RSB6_RHORT|nr:LuxR family transcriptional regulator [Rhodospirillum rubrum]ABC22979.1 transcriptional regulator, LuxR family [Rhodospirillum rubrum ATCC 11170]AEO48709.1 LuxR family transcriptional regulator [Rhodospirillum rubrum F11]MBK5954604.1 LuxR family transcriptional regulator [Rhodospirillum rubrum]QXG78965.1 LuxR family transcriptional regulator [Rhodospirillum rubrum]HAP98757.1 LuxR family transcriptional regulator [Rhodospirillum rubrum]